MRGVCGFLLLLEVRLRQAQPDCRDRMKINHPGRIDFYKQNNDGLEPCEVPAIENPVPAGDHPGSHKINEKCLRRQ
jgi:hypothetical protein